MLAAAFDPRPAGRIMAGMTARASPDEWTTSWTARDGTVLTIRPIRPDDAEEEAAAFAKLTPEEIRLRFFGAVRELSPAKLSRLTRIDYETEMAFVAMRPLPEGGEEMLAVARLVRDPGTARAEFALIVGAPVRRQGLGRYLMQRLFDWARAKGIEEIHGLILAENTPMLALARDLGFEVRASEAGPELRQVRRRVGGERAALAGGLTPPP
jgi:acetyltransferase